MFFQYFKKTLPKAIKYNYEAASLAEQLQASQSSYKPRRAAVSLAELILAKLPDLFRQPEHASVST